jgi:hypothetical protein
MDAQPKIPNLTVTDVSELILMIPNWRKLSNGFFVFPFHSRPLQFLYKKNPELLRVLDLHTGKNKPSHVQPNKQYWWSYVLIL